MATNRRFDSLAALSAAGFAGLCLFLGIYGFSFLDFSNIDWCILKTSDTSQHFLGAWAFLKDDWRWPLGIFYGLSSPDPTSITLVDGIPLMAFIVKLLRGPQSAPFQYLGLWCAISFVLQGIFALLLMKKLTSSLFFQFTGVFFLLLSVPFLNIGPCATALSSHFFILWALYLMLNNWERKVFIQWQCLLAFSLMVHPYITAMCAAVYFGVTLQKFYTDWKKTTKKVAISTLITNWSIPLICWLIILYLLGIFHIGLIGSTGVFGQSQVNLNCLLNPQSGNISALIFPMPVPMEAELLYTGVGAWLLLLFFIPALCKLLKRNSSLWKYYGFSALVLIFLVLFAMNCRIYWNNELLMHILWPPEIKKLASTFRAAGRFAWPAWYLILALSVAYLAREKVLWLKFSLVFVAISLQLYDLGKGIVAHKWAANMALRTKKYVCPYAPFEQFVHGRKKLYYSYTQENFAPPIYFALKNNLIVENFYFPRLFTRSLQKSEMEKLLNGEKFDSKGVYVLSDEEVKKVQHHYPLLKKHIYTTSERSLLFLPLSLSNHKHSAL